MIIEKIFNIRLTTEAAEHMYAYFPAATIEDAIENCYQTFPGCDIWEVKYEGLGYRPTTKTVTIEV